MNVTTHRAWHESFLPSKMTDLGEPRLLRSYTFLINGFAARLTKADTTTDRAICPGSKGLFVPVLEPGQKRWRLLSRVVEPGQNVPRAKKSLRPAGFEPKTYCLTHGFLTDSSK